MSEHWTRFLADIEEAVDSLKFEDGEECFYRGHGDERWPLLPTLLRHAAAEKFNAYETRVLEADLFFEFQSRARALHNENLGDWDILQFMRHHGLATRLLDWTETFAIALYFALETASAESTPCIWMLNPYALNESPKSWATRDLISPEYLGEDYSAFMTNFTEPYEFAWNHPVALYPMQRSARLQVQRGYFTIHGDDTRPIENINSKAVRKVAINERILPDARKFLHLSGIDHYSIFPDLDGLAVALHRKYGIGQ